MGTTHTTTVKQQTPTTKNMNTLIVLAALVACTLAAPSGYGVAPVHHLPAPVQYHSVQSTMEPSSRSLDITQSSTNQRSSLHVSESPPPSSTEYTTTQLRSQLTPTTSMPRNQLLTQ